jgi:NitT/TauT family transport system substrate-binding protein
MKNDKFKVMLDLNEEWKKINNSQFGFPQSTIIVKKDLYENNKEFVKAFLEKVKSGIEWAYTDKEALGTYCEEIGISAKKPIIVKALDKSNIKYVDIKDSSKEYKI